ncbi:MAG: glycosyltransferase [Ruminococcus flavefaciens]|nr:glycosyltransferase [Ruminococcus flavefaciens]
MKINNVKYSVLMCVYIKDNPEWLCLAINSMISQTLPADEFVIVKDGPVTYEIESALNKYCSKFPKLFHIVQLEKNSGLGEALRYGILQCRNEWIVRMDADDYSIPSRVEKQLKIAYRKNVDIVGSDVAEFIGMPDKKHQTALRVFPKNHKDIVKFSRRRTPFAHPAVIMKKSHVLSAGNYKSAFLHEDFDLFIRMLKQGDIGYTIKEPLVFIRINEDFYKRRGGVFYLKSLLKFNLKQLKSGWMKPSDFIIRSASNIVFCLLPNQIRDFMYRRVLRK